MYRMTSRKNRKQVKMPLINNVHNLVSFSDIGGLSDHIKTLKELIIFPLVYQNVYDKFRIRPPRGVLFYGPPGTGKTLVAGALALECTKDIKGKVTFFNRKGADILNKWVGESEERLRRLFQEAADCHPSIIFFDEIDGLAPIRSSKQDQVHSSIVATLLSLMDGLDKLPGVVVIGATNRIDSIDPALRRSGRFDRELYFPLPAYDARREILEVHIRSWTTKPKTSFLSYLADITAGYSGSDIQALCSEAVMSCLRRNYPQIHNTKINIRTRNLKVLESDFITARNNIKPSVDRQPNPMRRLSVTIKPLLQRQLNQIMQQIQSKNPHFTVPRYKFDIGTKRYSGKLLLIGNESQGQSTHMAPAILHALEHLPSYIIDIQALYKCANRTAEEICVQQLTQSKMNLPSIVLAHRLDEWWNIVEESTRAILISMLKDLQAGLPQLIIATATDNLPSCVTNLFNEPSSIIYEMENPNEDERWQFFYPLFMENALHKISAGKHQSYKQDREISVHYSEVYIPIQNTNSLQFISSRPRRLRKCSENLPTENNTQDTSNSVKRSLSFENDRPYKIRKTSSTNIHAINSELSKTKISTSSWSPLFSFARRIRESITNMTKEIEKEKTVETHFINKMFSKEIKEIPSTSTKQLRNSTKNQTNKECYVTRKMNLRSFAKNLAHKQANVNDCIIPGDSRISDVDRIKYLFRHTIATTTNNMSITQLELLYDMLATCINRENQNVSTMLENIGNILNDAETKKPEVIKQGK